MNQPEQTLGLVISYFGQSVEVITPQQEIVQCPLRRNQALPVVGDQVYFDLFTKRITSILSRRSLLAKGDKRGELKPIAANIDYVLITTTFPPFSSLLIDRYLVAVELLAIQAILVFNKMDLCSRDERKTLIDVAKIYQAISYPIHYTSAKSQEGMTDLLTTLTTKNGVLVGPSGVGKSSLIASLSQQELVVGETSTSGAGRHTTTANRLYHLPNGGALIDSPGVREFNLWKISKADLIKGFREFRPFLGQCKFKDCSHIVEPECAIQKAVQDNKISLQRYNHFKDMAKNI